MTTYGPNANNIEFTTTQTAPGIFTVAFVDTATSTTLQSFTNVLSANIVTTNSSTLSLLTVGDTSSYFIVPGITVSIDFGASGASSPTVYVGGNATITSLANILSTDTLDVVGGTVTASNGLVAGALSSLVINLSEGGDFSGGTSLLSLLSSTTVNFGTGGGTLVADAGGAAINLSSLTINGFSNGTDKIDFQGLSAPLGSYSVSNTTGGQIISLFSTTGTSLGSVTVAGTSFSTGTVTAGQSGPLTVTETGSSGAFNVTFDATPGSTACFVGATLIATADGEKRIDELVIGDLVLTNSGNAVPVRWIGRRKVSPRFADPMRIMPVRICAGALGDSFPSRDLLISPDHAVLIQGALVNAGALVNGITILRETRRESFVYYHIEVDAHALILAEGVSAETFIDNIDRMVFDNWAEHAKMFGDMLEKQEMTYPRVKSARQLPHAIRKTLEAQMPASHAAA